MDTNYKALVDKIQSWRKQAGGVFGVGRDIYDKLKKRCSEYIALKSQYEEAENNYALITRRLHDSKETLRAIFECVEQRDTDDLERVLSSADQIIKLLQTRVHDLKNAYADSHAVASRYYIPLITTIDAARDVEGCICAISDTPSDRMKPLVRRLRRSFRDVYDYGLTVHGVVGDDFIYDVIKYQVKSCKGFATVLKYE